MGRGSGHGEGPPEGDSQADPAECQLAPSPAGKRCLGSKQGRSNFPKEPPAKDQWQSNRARPRGRTGGRTDGMTGAIPGSSVL